MSLYEIIENYESLKVKQEIIWNYEKIIYSNQQNIIELLSILIYGWSIIMIVQLLYMLIDIYEYYREPPLNLNTKCSVASF